MTFSEPYKPVRVYKPEDAQPVTLDIFEQAFTDEQVMSNTVRQLQENPHCLRVAVSREHYLWLASRSGAADESQAVKTARYISGKLRDWAAQYVYEAIRDGTFEANDDRTRTTMIEDAAAELDKLADALSASRAEVKFLKELANSNGNELVTDTEGAVWLRNIRAEAAEAALATAREEAARDMRERCAKVCDDYGRDGSLTRAYECETADELAARIRALTTEADNAAS